MTHGELIRELCRGGATLRFEPSSTDPEALRIEWRKADAEGVHYLTRISPAPALLNADLELMLRDLTEAGLYVQPV